MSEWTPNKGRQPVKDDVDVVIRLDGYSLSGQVHKAGTLKWALNAPTPILEWARA